MKFAPSTRVRKTARRPRVAVVYPFFPHYRAAVFRELLERGAHEYLLVGDTRSMEAGVAEWQPEDPNRFLFAPCRQLAFFSFLLQRGLARLGLRRDLDAIVYLGNPYFVSTWVSAALARVTGKRVLFWTHGWTREERGPKAWLRTLFYRLAHGLLLYGNYARETGVARGFAPEKLHVIYNSLDYEAQKRFRQRLDPERLAAVKRSLFERPELPMVLCTARLTRRCRFDLLLEAQARLARTGHVINVLLVGDGPEQSALEAQARQLGVPVRFQGACYDEEALAGFTMAAHVTVSPGKVGLTAIQSLAYGTPVITHSDPETQGPEWEAIVPGKSGDFFKPGDVDDLAAVIRRWTSDSSVRGSRREECQAVIERFYNPTYQRVAIDRAVLGHSANIPLALEDVPLAA